MPSAACPPPPELAAFHRGDELPPGTADLLTAHVAGCELCENALLVLDHLVKTDVVVVRQAAGTAPAAGGLTPAAAEPGAVVGGRYKLIEPLGEGGMGSVWMAQQAEPVRRVVAVKLIKPGMDSRQVLARFAAERQALALMDHPNIARVLDAGQTDQGRPYFVMELVKGVPITRYCDDHKLSLRDRLRLFVPVCQAVQHAHQKGVIHRDIKPSNVLVARYDDRPVPKVIDFGVAKAAGQPLTDRTLVTGFGAVVGTLEYMSPEQAAFNALDVDTRSDVYALGVLLYELLTGSTPFARADPTTGMLELLRLVREFDPPRPSTRLTDTATAPAVAAARGSDVARLAGTVRGELDWIVMGALEKDRSRRYQTANGLAADVERYLAGEPVQAVPPSAGYRVRKFARRNRGPVAAAGLLFLALIGGVVGTTIGLVRAEVARGQLVENLEVSRRHELAARDAEVRAAADRDKATVAHTGSRATSEFLYELIRQGDVTHQAAWREVVDPDITLREVLQYATDTAATRDFRMEGRAEASIRWAIGDVLVGVGDPAKAIPHFERSRELLFAHTNFGPNHPETLFGDHKLSGALRAVGRTAEALALSRSAMARAAEWNRTHEPVNPSPLLAATDTAVALRDLGNGAEAVRLLEGAVAWAAEHPPGDAVSVDGIRAHLAETYRRTGRPDDARLVAVALLDGPLARDDDLFAAYCRETVGRAAVDAGDWAAADAQFRVALATRQRRQPRHWTTSLTAAWLGRTAAGLGDATAGDAQMAEAYQHLSACRSLIPATSRPLVSQVVDWLAVSAIRRGDRSATLKWLAERATYPRELAPLPKSVRKI